MTGNVTVHTVLQELSDKARIHKHDCIEDMLAAIAGKLFIASVRCLLFIACEANHQHTGEKKKK